MCRSNQVNEIGEEKSSSEEECNLIQSFDSCDEFEIMVVEPRVDKLPKNGVERVKSKIIDANRINTTQDITKIDIRRDPRSHQTKALKALVRIKNQIINMTIDTGSPVSFLNSTTANNYWLDHPKSNSFLPKT